MIAAIAKWQKPSPPPTITTDADDTVTSPAAAFSWKAHRTKVIVMKSYLGDGMQLLHGGGSGPNATAFRYELTV
jgi:hypothetical protein